MAAAVDPGAIYNTTLADLGLQESNTLATIGENEGFLKTNVGNAENTLTGQEPGTYTAESNRANRGGLLTSGVNTQRKATVASSYAEKRTANQAKLSQGLSTDQKARQTAGLTKTLGEHTAAATRAANEDALQAANPTVAPAAPATPRPAAVAPPAGPKGISIPPGYSYDAKTGWVHGPNGTAYRLK
jgi:hypothetical protein